ncbi:MAG: YggS family pyridoxal phosphate-dependent enzyme [Lachnospiraceae bacterium]|nr:YggS family pyridoxal phosphate-dependent enzyme [Lachnospiraceae bacterium]
MIKLKEVEQNIQIACKNANRNREDVTLIAVSKTKPVELLQEVYDENVRNFGENKVQELCEKYEVLPKDILWHMIGHLQTNKVKYLIGKTTLIHSVDSLKLAQEIEKQAAKADIVMNILIEVNIANESSKFGIQKEETLSLIREIAKLPHVNIKGLMTIAPYVTNPEDNRLYFRQIKELSVDIANQNIDNVSMDVLSMGMTGDYMVAIEEGATMVRVGTGIFGERDYTTAK